MSLGARFALASCSLVLGVFLVLLVLKLVPGSLDIITTSIVNINPMWGLLVIGLTALNIWLTVVKWRLVFASIGEKTGSHQTGSFMLYVAAGALSAHFMPRLVGVFGARSVAVKYHKVASFGKGLISILYDLIFDIFIPFIAFPFSMLAVTKIISVPLALVLMFLAAALTAVFVPSWYRPAVRSMFRVYGFLQRSIRGSNGEAAVSKVETLDALAHDLARVLLGLATAKYLVLILRSGCVAKAAGLDIGLGTIATVFPVVQLAFLAGLTPAGLGVVEWGWVGALGQVGIELDTAGSFAVLHRLLVLASVGVVTFVLLIQQGLRRLVKGGGALKDH